LERAEVSREGRLAGFHLVREEEEGRRGEERMSEWVDV